MLAASCFAKALAYHLCAECGFAGGLFLPMMTISACLGRVFVNCTGVTHAVAMSCSIIALAAALVPAPFFLAVLSLSVMVVGPQGLVPVFACAGTAYLFCLGVGVPQGLLAAATARQAAGTASSGGGLQGEADVESGSGGGGGRGSSGELGAGKEGGGGEAQEGAAEQGKAGS